VAVLTRKVIILYVSRVTVAMVIKDCTIPGV